MSGGHDFLGWTAIKNSCAYLESELQVIRLEKLNTHKTRLVDKKLQC